jgi:hypothetical protein
MAQLGSCLQLEADADTIRKSLEEENTLPLFSEIGRDMSNWPTAAHFISWLALCPDNDISGGKLLWRGARKVKNRAGHLFRLAAGG